jgi:diadenosine tetraphosphate (Ap4A) HIT family hydrolase
MTNSRGEQNKCPFCNISDDINRRIFYKRNNWIAFLAAPFYAKGHTLLSSLQIGNKCPFNLSDLSVSQLQELGLALHHVSSTIKNIYKVDNVLIASLRGNIVHFHLHLLPLHRETEDRWREIKHYNKGHLFEFLGDLEKENFMKTLLERQQKKWDENVQRLEITKTLIPEVWKLRNETKYQSSF